MGFKHFDDPQIGLVPATIAFRMAFAAFLDVDGVVESKHSVLEALSGHTAMAHTLAVLRHGML